VGYPVQVNNTSESLMFLMVDSTDHITGMAGVVPVVTLSKNGAAFAVPVGAVTEVGDGWYRVAPNATDANTVGPLVLHATALGCDPTDETFDIQSVPLAAPGAGGVVIGTYGGDPSASALDWIRFTIQDTGPSFSGEQWYWGDTEIIGILSTVANATVAAGEILLAWARRIGHNPDFRIGRFSENWNAAARLMEEKGKELLQSAAASGIGAFVGGTSVSDKSARSGNADRTKGAFRRGRFDNPGAGW